MRKCAAIGMARAVSDCAERFRSRPPSLATTTGVATFAAPTDTRLGRPIALVATCMEHAYTADGPSVDLTPAATVRHISPRTVRTAPR